MFDSYSKSWEWWIVEMKYQSRLKCAVPKPHLTRQLGGLVGPDRGNS
jgi:hypothetical protein